ncbi:MAG: DUF4159 domain-containing protein [Armatimonadetes bacterium]|nr:DUF4159 domain-containing protein [Armatimonadota bacterium]
MTKFISVAVALSATAASFAQNTAAIKVQINAGILYLDAQRVNGSPYVPTPHVWTNLDSDRSVKPSNWNIVNPRSSGRVNATTLTQWGNIQSFWSIATGLPALGDRISKQNAAYWQVPLGRTSADELGDYNILLLPVGNKLSVTPSEREKLRRFVDQGGILWIAYETTATSGVIETVNPAPVPFMVSANFTSAVYGDYSSPLLTSPNSIASSDLLRMASNAMAFRAMTPGDLGGNSVINEWPGFDGNRIQAIAGTDAARQIVGLTKLGEGFVVITSCNTAESINRSTQSLTSANANRGFWSGTPAYDSYFNTAAKLVVNMISLSSSYEGLAGGPRKSSSSSLDVSSPPIERFRAPGIPTDNMVLIKGRMVRIAGGMLQVFDANPSSDIDNDGNPNDGVQADPVGGADLIWETNVGGGTSGVTVAEVTGAISDPDRILFVDAGGSLRAFSLYPDLTNNPVDLGTAAVPTAHQVGGQPFTPTVQDGIAFMSDTTTKPQANGRVWMVDLATMTPPNTVGGKGYWAVEGAYRLVSPSGSPTVGYIPIADNSGGVDRVVYVPTKSVSSQRRPAGLTSLWLGARGEKPTLSQGGAQLVMRTRASDQGLPIYAGGGSLGVKITLIDMQTGLPYTDAQANDVFNTLSINSTSQGEVICQRGSNNNYPGPGGGNIVFDTIGNALIPNTTVRIDYTIDWGAPVSGGASSGQPENYVRGDVQFPDGISLNKEVKGNIAMGPNGNLFVVVGGVGTVAPAANGGSFWCMKEQGRGDFRVLYRWELHDSYGPAPSKSLSIPLVGANENFVYDSSIVDYDDVLKFIPFLDVKMKEMRFESGPVVRGNTAYVLATSQKFLPFPGAAPPYITTVLAFNADPKAAKFTLTGLNNNSLQLVQPDLSRTESTMTTAQMGSLQPGQYTLDRDEVTGVSKIVVDNFSASTRGVMNNVLAANLPIYARTNGGADIKIEPEASVQDGVYVPGNAGGSWNPLRWYQVHNGLYCSTSGVATGNTLYFGGGSYLPGFLTTGFTFPPARRGLMYSMDTSVSPSDLKTPPGPTNGHVNGAPLQTWNKYLTTVNVVGAFPNVDISASPYLKWPQFTGIVNIDEFRVRLLQACLDITDTTVSRIAAGENTVAVAGDSRSYGFRRGDFLIADQGRVLRVDSAGNPLLARENTLAGGAEVETSNQSSTVPLSRPWRVYPAGGTASWIVDAGADRIMQVDNAGRETRVIKSFNVDPKFSPPGLPDHVNKNLRIPRDFATWTDIVPLANNKFTNAKNFEFWRHYLIADQGNFRILELVDRYDYDPTTKRVGAIVTYNDVFTGTTEAAYAMAYGHSSPELSGKQYAYNSIARYRRASDGRILYAFGFGNIEPNKFGLGIGAATGDTGDVRSGNGGIVIYDPTGQTQSVVTQYTLNYTANLWDPTTNAFAPKTVNKTLKITGLNSLTVSTINGVSRFMISDANGLVELDESGNAIWAMPNNVYRAIRRNNAGVLTQDNPLAFQAAFAKRLENGDVLVVNAYQGKYFNDPGNRTFNGEVILVEGGFALAPGDRGFSWSADNLGFDRLSVRFSLPPLAGIRGLTVPVFADQR